MRRSQSNGGAATAPPAAAEPFEPEPPGEDTNLLPVLSPRDTALSELPPGELVGIDEFGMSNWISFDAPRGKMVCKNQEAEYDEFQAVILESRVVRVMKDEEGQVFCASLDRVTADTGRIGRECEPCEDRDVHCHPRWWMAWQEVESGLVFAHTLSQTGSLNFNRYANSLLRQGLSPGKVLTRIFVEEARRQRSGTTYRRLALEQVGTSE